MLKTDFLIIGAGVIGLTLARELLRKGIDDIIIIEKEPSLAAHASGRNSGVLHAGIYYPSDSLKAQFCLNGSNLLKAYCEQHQLNINRCGKVIVARNEDELETLDMLAERAKANGANVEIIDEQQLDEIEPAAKTVSKALFAHDTAVIDPKEIMQQLHDELAHTESVRLLFNTHFIKHKKGNTIVTNKGEIHYKTLINAAGAYADKIAHHFEVGKHYFLLPFKGLYKKLKPAYNHLITRNIYPVPDIRNPFLGVHFTKSATGEVYLGPTAIPAFGREHYGFLKGIELEAIPLMWRNFILLLTNEKFRNVALTEPQKYLFKHFFNDAKMLVKELKPDWIASSPKVGIRPQLVNWQTKELVMDFMVEKGENSIHILNAISPAFTCSMAFSRHVVENYL